MQQIAVDDDDPGAIFNARKVASQEKRAKNRANSTALLTEKGVFFTSHNQGAHLIVADAWDFWPGTGKFGERRGRSGKPKREGRGVHNLLRIIQEEGHAAPV